MNWKIPLFKIYWDKDDINSVSEAISCGMNWAVGPEVTEFEKKLSEYLDIEYCLTFNSGTSALHAALLAYGIGHGDEVIVPSFTFIATANAALFVGAKPVFADIEEVTCGLDVEDVERKITSRTKAILPIHFAGCPCLIDGLKQVAEKHNLLLIEDAAEALGADINGTKIGSIGDSSILSFCQNKIITTGDGGAIVTNSREIYEKLQLIRSHGRSLDVDYFSSTEHADYVTLGYNFRMSNINAALGLAQFNKLTKLIEMRRENARLMDSRLSPIEGITPLSPPEGFYHVYQMYTIRVSAECRDGLMNYLEENGIQSKVYFPPVHQTAFYKDNLNYDCTLPVTESISQQVVTLPMYPSLSEEEIIFITDHVVDFLSKVL